MAEKAITWYNRLKEAINGQIKENGKREITGAKLNSVLNQMVDALGKNMTFGGVVSPATVIDNTDDNPVFYLALEAGNYPYCGNIVVGQGQIAFLFRDANNIWHQASWNASDENFTTEEKEKLQGLPTQEELRDALGAKANAPESKPGSDNLASFDEDGNLKDSGLLIPVPGIEEIDHVLASGENGLEWVPKPADGKSALDIYNELNPNAQLGKAGFISKLQQKYPMKPVAYYDESAIKTIGTPFTSALDNNNLFPTPDTMGILYIMPNSNTNPTGSISFTTINTGENEYAWVNLGAVDVPDNALTEEMVDNECVDGATDKPASANVVMNLKAKMKGVTASEEKVQLVTSGEGQNVYDGKVVGATGDIDHSGSNDTNYKYVEFEIPSNVKRIRFMTPAGTGWTGGWAIGHYFEGNFVADRRSAYVSGREFTVEVKEGETHFRTNCYMMYGNPLTNRLVNYYCYLQSGDNVVDTINNAVKPANDKLFGEFERISLGAYQTGRITSYNLWAENGKHYLVDISQYRGETIEVVAVETGSNATQIAFFTSNETVQNQQPPYCNGTEGRIFVSVGTTRSFVVPEDCVYLYVLRYATNSDLIVTPKSISLVISSPIEDEISNVVEEKVHELTDDRLDAIEENIFDVYEDINLGSYKTGRIIASSGKFSTKSGGTYYIADISNLQDKEIVITAGNYTAYYAFLEETLPNTTDTAGINPSYVAGTGLYSLKDGVSVIEVIPSTCSYLYVNRTMTNSYNRTPSVKEIVSIGFDTKLNERINVIEKELETGGKDNEIKERIKSTASVDDDGYIVTLLHFSDIHGSATNMQRILDFYNEYKKDENGLNGYIDNIISTGDLVYDNYNNSIDSMLRIEGGNEILNVIGNHETRVYNGQDTDWFGATMKQCYDKFIAPFKDNWGDVHTTTDKTYYYVDYVTTEGDTTKRNVRLIVYDIMHYNDSGQNEWLESTLEDARVKGMHVMIALHSATQYTEHYDASVPSTFTIIGFNPSRYTDKDYENPYIYIRHDIKPYVKNFIDEGGVFICYIAGHFHRDYIGKPTTEGFTDQYTFAVSTANSTTKESHDFVRASDSDLFNIISINTRKKVMSIFRVGSSIDVFNRKVESLVFNYDTHEIIYQS